MKRMFFVMLIMLLLPINVLAGCSDEEIIRLQKMANNINTSYTYDETTKSFTLTFTNFNEELVISDISNKKDYLYRGELNINNLKSGKYNYYVYALDKNCYDNELGIKSVSLPFYNIYYNYDECKNIKNYRYCSKWLPNEIDYDTWKKKVTEYKNSIEKEEQKKIEEKKRTTIDRIRDFIVAMYVEHYYVFLPIIIISLCAIIYLKDKSDEII